MAIWDPMCKMHVTIYSDLKYAVGGTAYRIYEYSYNDWVNSHRATRYLHM